MKNNIFKIISIIIVHVGFGSRNPQNKLHRRGKPSLHSLSWGSIIGLLAQAGHDSRNESLKQNVTIFLDIPFAISLRRRARTFVPGHCSVNPITETYLITHFRIVNTFCPRIKSVVVPLIFARSVVDVLLNENRMKYQAKCIQKYGRFGASKLRKE